MSENKFQNNVQTLRTATNTQPDDDDDVYIIEDASKEIEQVSVHARDAR